MFSLAISLYSLSLIAQLATAAISASLIKKFKIYRTGWIFLAIGFSLMIGRRVSPILFALKSGEFNLTDAILSLPISFCLLFGVIGIRKLLSDHEQVNNQLLAVTKTDYLTLALSRQETIERAKLEIARGARSKKPLALLSLDIDHFKKVNDKFGHQVGDQVLKQMVSFIKSKIRNIDFIGRMGGEEFLITLPDTDAIEAMEVAERLREEISNFCCDIHSGQEIKISVSIGVEVVTAEEGSTDYAKMLKTYLDRADHAMYMAKKAGRNKCCLNPQP